MLTLWVLARTISTVHRCTHPPRGRRCGRGGAGSRLQTLLPRQNHALAGSGRSSGRSIRRSSAISPVLDHQPPIAECRRFSDVVGNENGGEAAVMPHPLPVAAHGNVRQRVQDSVMNSFCRIVRLACASAATAHLSTRMFFSSPRSGFYPSHDVPGRPRLRGERRSQRGCSGFRKRHCVERSSAVP
jgi:hypothetical protein